MSDLQCIKDIRVGLSKIGSRGVFAKKTFKKGQIIEEAPFIAVYKEHILGKMLDYVFDFDDHMAVCIILALKTMLNTK